LSGLSSRPPGTPSKFTAINSLSTVATVKFWSINFHYKDFNVNYNEIKGELKEFKLLNNNVVIIILTS
jgi:hypothetical protein